MCGICGIAYADVQRPAERERLRRMREAISHRGPDGHGEYGVAGAAFGHARLSIIDLAGGTQPLGNEDGSIQVTFNGEIYNYRELTDELVARGHRFRTRSDTEVLVHAYEEWGDSFPARLNGMFAFAIHDPARGRVLLGRDHLGIKPLFYTVTDDGLFFASEIKSVLAGAGRPARVRPEALAEYLIFRYVAGSRSFYEDVDRLPPGHVAIWERGALSVRPFWEVPVAAPGRAIPMAEASRTLDAHLERSVGMQMMSEVPIGTFCSGGVDSGLVTGYASRLSPHQLSTFSVGFDDPAWDESALALDTARRFGTDHHVMIARPEEFGSLLARLVHYHDEPLSHPNSVPIYLLSRFAREHVTVVLTGEGADELFGGYPRYHVARLHAAASVLPTPAREALAGLLRLAPGHRAGKVADVLPLAAADALILNSAYVSPALVERLTGIPASDALAERRRLLERAHVPGDSIATLSRYELSTYLGCALDRMDRMSMASGLEGRVPFLDVPLVEWGVGLHSSLKVRGRENKRVVKQLAGGSLSPAITRGAKSGFGLPIGDWFRGPELAALRDRMRDPAHPAAEHFDRGAMQGLVGEHLRGEADHAEALWLIANVYLWYDVQHGTAWDGGDEQGGQRGRAIATAG